MSGALGFVSQPVKADVPGELPAIVVQGYVEDDYGFIYQNLIWTIPYNSYGSQNMMGIQYLNERIPYGRMTSIPARIAGPTRNLGNPTLTRTGLSVAIDTDGDPNERGYDLH